MKLHSTLFVRAMRYLEKHAIISNFLKLCSLFTTVLRHFIYTVHSPDFHFQTSQEPVPSLTSEAMLQKVSNRMKCYLHNKCSTRTVLPWSPQCSKLASLLFWVQHPRVLGPSRGTALSLPASSHTAQGAVPPPAYLRCEFKPCWST